MRSFLLIFGTVLVLGLAFGLYTWMQPAGTGTGATDAPGGAGAVRQRPVRPSEGGTVLGEGTDVWVKRYDPKTGELATQFRAERYDPQKDGSVLVDRPQAEFMLDEGRVLRVEGKTGVVVVPPPEEQQGGGGDDLRAQGGQMAPPSRGSLKDVRILLYASADDADGGVETPVLSVEMDNATFDNDTFRIMTEGYVDPAGNRVGGDQVPVKVRGQDYDFDGRGLTIRWNDLSNRLELLEIAHGERLVVKNPAALSSAMEEDPSETPESAGVDRPGRETEVVPGPTTAPQPRKSKKKSTRRAPATTTAAPATTAPARRRGADTIYLASFERDVRIVQAELDVALADGMGVKFRLGDLDEKREAGQAESEKPTTRASRGANRRRAPTTAAAGASTQPTAEPATQPAATDLVAAATQPAPATAPATAPETAPALDEGPIVIHWSGKLRVTPLDGEPPDAVAPGEAEVTLAGSPLRLTREGTTVTCASLTYTTADRSVRFEANDQVPAVTMRDKQGAVVTTPLMRYAEATGRAHLTGASRAEIPLGGADAGRTMSVTWADDCALILGDDGAGGRQMERAELSGGVAVVHPQLELTSDKLGLAFAPPAGGASPATTQPETPDLQRVTADGSVRCVLKDPGGDQTITAGRLDLETSTNAAGELYPRVIRADDNVVARAADGEMRAGHVVAKLVPVVVSADAPVTQPTTAAVTHAESATQPTTDAVADATTQPAEPANDATFGAGDVALESLEATGGVELRGADGVTATAGRLGVEVRDAKTVVQLVASADAPARLADADGNVLEGPLVRTVLDDGHAEVLGPGSISGERPAEREGEVPTPFRVTWAGGVELDARGDRVHFRDQVVLTGSPPGGAATTGTADRLEVVLARKPAPATKPATQASTRPATEPISPDLVAATMPTTAPATRPAEREKRGGGGGAGFLLAGGFGGGASFGEMLKDKEPVTATLSGSVTVNSVEPGPAGEVLRRVYLTADALSHDVRASRTTVPGPGALLFEDHRAADDAGDAGDDSDRAAGRVGSRGRTAFKWQRGLSYASGAREATMEGDVFINHVPDPDPDAGGQPFRLETQRVRAELEAEAPAASEPASTQPTTAPATRPSDPADAMSLRRLVADGGVRVEAEHAPKPGRPAERIQIDAEEIEYTAADSVLTARGSESDPIRIADDDGQWRGSVQELRWNTRTDELKITKGRARVR